MNMFSRPSNNLFAGGLSRLQLCGGTDQEKEPDSSDMVFLTCLIPPVCHNVYWVCLCTGWVGSWPGAGYHTNIVAGGPCCQSGEQGRTARYWLWCLAEKWTCSLTTVIMLLEMIVQVGNSSGLYFSITQSLCGMQEHACVCSLDMSIVKKSTFHLRHVHPSVYSHLSAWLFLDIFLWNMI